MGDLCCGPQGQTSGVHDPTPRPPHPLPPSLPINLNIIYAAAWLLSVNIICELFNSIDLHYCISSVWWTSWCFSPWAQPERPEIRSEKLYGSLYTSNQNTTISLWSVHSCAMTVFLCELPMREYSRVRNNAWKKLYLITGILYGCI